MSQALNADENLLPQENLLATKANTKKVKQGLGVTTTPAASATTEPEDPFYAKQEEAQNSITNFVDTVKSGPNDVRFKNLKKIVHDNAYQESTENAVLNQFEAQAYEQEYSTVLTPDRANALSKELGSDIKFDKDVTEGHVRFAVQKQQNKRLLQQLLAEFSETNDYSTWQDIQLMSEALSGSVGAAELGATVLGGALLAPLAGAAVAGVASKIPAAKSVAQGIRYAQKAMVMERKMQAAANDVKLMQSYANTVSDLVSKSRATGFLSNLGYDSYRMSQGALGMRASLPTTMIPFALDGMLSNMPRVSLMLANNNLLNAEEYTVKDAVVETLLSGFMGGAIPAVGAGIKGSTSFVGKLIAGIAERNEAAKAANTLDQLLKTGTTTITKADEEAAQAGIEGMLNITKQPSMAMVQATEAIGNSNASKEEFANLLQWCMDVLAGKRAFSLNEMPLKSEFMSNIFGMRRVLEEGITEGLDNVAMFNRMMEQGFSTLSEGENALFQEGKACVAHFTNEGGELGKTKALGITKQDAIETLMDAYRYYLLEDAEAYDRLLTKFDKHSRLRDTLAAFLKKYGEAIDAHINTHKLRFVKLDGSTGRPVDVVTDIIRQFFVPEYDHAQQVLAANAKNIESKGPGLPADQVAAAQKAVDEYKRYYDLLLEHKTTKKGEEVIDLRGGEELGKKSETGLLGKFSKQLEEITDAEEQLLDADSGLRKLFTEKAEETKAKLERGDFSDLGTVYENENVTFQNMRSRSEDVQKHVERLTTSKENLNHALETNKDATLIQAVEDTTRKAYQEGRGRDSFYIQMQELTGRVESFLQENFTTIRNNLSEKISGSTAIANWAIKVATEEMKPEQLATLWRTGDNPLRQMIMDTVGAPLRALTEYADGTHMITNLQMEEVLDDAIEGFITQISEDPDFLSRFVQAIDITMESPDLAKNVILLEEQRESVSKALQPLMDRVACIAMQLQNDAIHTQTQWLNAAQAIIDAPALAREKLISLSTFTPLNFKDSARSIENLSDIAGEVQNLRQTLLAEDLLDYAQNNLESVNTSIYYIQKYGNVTDAEKAGVKLNSQASRVAEIYLDNCANLQNRLWGVGSNINDVAGLMDSAKVRNIIYTTPAGVEAPVNRGLAGFKAALVQGIKDEEQRYQLLEKIQSVFQRWEAPGQAGKAAGVVSKVKDFFTDHSEIAKSNAAKQLFATLDLDKHFNRKGYSPISYNQLRDYIMSNDYKSLRSMVEQYGADRLIGALDKVIEHIHSGHQALKPNGEVDVLKSWPSLLDRLSIGSQDANGMFNGNTPKYLTDLHQPLYFKDDTTALRMLKQVGYADFNTMSQQTFAKAKRAYAILETTGSRPKQFVEGLVNFTNNYAKQGMGAKTLSQDVAKKMVIDEYHANQAVRLMALACGAGSVPAGTGLRMWRAFSNMIGAPMLMKAGFKSFADYEYQHQALIYNGLKASTDLSSYTTVANHLLRAMQDREFANHLGLSQALRMDFLMDSLTLTDRSAVAPIKKFLAAFGTQELNEHAPWLVRFEALSKLISDTVLNKCAFIGPLTDFNRGNAALTIMESLGSFVNKETGEVLKYAEIVSRQALGDQEIGQRFAQYCQRHGISAEEWDNFYAKYFIENTEDYMARFSGKTPDYRTGTKLFFADNADRIPAEELRAFLQKQMGKRKVTDLMVEQYRTRLADNAAILINKGADEMTTLPNIRVNDTLALGTMAGSMSGEIVRSFTKFQSFPMAVTKIHWGRKAAGFFDEEQLATEFSNNMFRQLFFSTTNTDKAAVVGSFTGFLIEAMLAQMVVGEALNTLSGVSHKTWKDSKGEWNPAWFMNYLGQALGIGGVVLDMATNALVQRGTGGGIALPGLPVVSALARPASEILTAATRESTKGHRAEAVSAATVKSLVGLTGFSTAPMFQAAWMYTIGDHLQEMAMGPKAYREYRKRLYKGAWTPGWFAEAMDSLQNQ